MLFFRFPDSAAAAAVTNKLTELLLELPAFALPAGVEDELSEAFRGRPIFRRGGELPPASGGFLNAAAAAAFLVNNTAVRRLTPDGDPAVNCGLTLVLTGVTGNAAGREGVGGGLSTSEW